MKRVTLSSASCAVGAVALLGLAGMGYCRWMIATTPPGGSGEFKGMNHLGWRVGILLLSLTLPPLSFIGLCLGLTGHSRSPDDRLAAVWGVSLNALMLILSTWLCFVFFS